MRSQIVFSILGALAVLACEDDTAKGVWKQPPLRPVSICTGSKQVMGANLIDPHAFALGKDSIYVQGYLTASSNKQIIAVSMADLRLTPVADGECESLFVEGDTIYCAEFDQLLSVPTSGGTLGLVVDAGLVEGPGHDAIVGAPVRDDAGVTNGCVFGSYALDQAYFYMGGTCGPLASSISVWRVPRTGGPPQRLGAYGPDIVQAMALTPQGVLVNTLTNNLVFPYESSSLFDLGRSRGRFAGLDQLGSYFVPFAPADGPSSQSFPLLRIPATGAQTEEAWPDAPYWVNPFRIFRDAVGNLLIVADEELDDNQFYTEFWSQNAKGETRLLSCIPDPDSSAVYAATSVGDTVYGLMTNLSSGQPAIVVKVAP